MIPLLQTKTADTAHMGIFVSDTRPLSQFLGGAFNLWVGPGDETTTIYGEAYLRGCHGTNILVAFIESGCFIQFILHRISTTGTKRSDHCKVSAIDMFHCAVIWLPLKS